MIAAVEEVVFFTIEILQDAPLTYAKNDTTETYGSIEYSNAKLIEKLQDSYFYTKEEDDADGKYDGKLLNPVTEKDITTALNAAWTEEQKQAGYRKLEYYAAYIVKNDDLDSTIINEVNFGYTFKSDYSTASTSTSGSALADIRVVGKYMDSIVVDFGMPVSIEDTRGDYLFKEIDLQKTLELNGLQNNELHLYYDGDVRTLTYTPSRIMKAAVPIVLYNAKGDSINSFSVYPATTVYYEESFINWDSKWSVQGSPSVTSQKSQLLGKSNDEYGYDENYASNVGKSAGTQAAASAMNATGTFSFKGTGLDVYANCTKDSGSVYFLLRNSAGKSAGLYIVNTVVSSGKTEGTVYEKGEYCHMAITSIRDLPYDTYNVTVKVCSKDKPVYIDGVRIHGTIEDQRIYASDLEDNPAYYELRDMVLNALVVKHNVTGSLQYGSLQEMASQVYKQLAETDEKPTAVITTNGDFDFKDDVSGMTAEQKVQDLLDNGPKNELFLYSGQTLTFNVTTKRCMQIGLKAPVGETSYSIRLNGKPLEEDVENYNLKSSVDMFYKLNSAPTQSAEEYTVTITNNGSNILSITTLKICDDPSAYFNSLTAKDIEYTLATMGYTFPEEENKVPESTVKPEDTTKPESTAKPGSSTTTEETKSEAEDTKDSSSSPLPTEIVKVEVADSTKEPSKVDQKETTSTSTDVKEEITESEEAVVESEKTVEEDIELETETDIQESEISETTESEESNGNPIVMIGSAAAILAAVIALIFGFKKSKKR